MIYDRQQSIIKGLIGFFIFLMVFVSIDMIGSDVVPTKVVVLDKIYEPPRTETRINTTSSGNTITSTDYIPEKYKLIVKEVDDDAYSYTTDESSNDIMTVQVDLQKYGSVDKEDITVVDIYYGWITGIKYN